MGRHYVTFGQEHKHILNRLHLYKDCVVTFEASNYEEGRKKTRNLFGPKFFTDYHGNQWLDSKLRFFPKGYVDIDTEEHICNEDSVLIILNDGSRHMDVSDFLIKELQEKMIGISVCCSICMKAAIDSRSIHDI